MSASFKAQPSDVATVRLSNGSSVPAISYGLGTVLIGKDVSPLVEEALKIGYRHFDLAYSYHTSEGVGKAWKASGVPRNELFFSYKGADLSTDPNETKGMRWYLEEALKELQTDYVDLYLLHSNFFVPDVQKAWKEMEELHREGLVKSLGISNPTSESLKQILEVATIKPVMMDIEWQPYALASYDRLLPLAKEHGMTLSGYSPMVPIFWRQDGALRTVLQEIIDARGKDETPGQILLAWTRQTNHGVVATTTTKPERLSEQIQPFVPASKGGMPPLSETEVARITEEGAKEPYRMWGKNWPYMMHGEDDQSPADAVHYPPPQQQQQ